MEKKQAREAEGGEDDDDDGPAISFETPSCSRQDRSFGETQETLWSRVRGRAPGAPMERLLRVPAVDHGGGGGGNGSIPAGGGQTGKEQQAAGVGILLQIMMLVLSFVLGHVLRRHKFYYLPEASASLLIGAFRCSDSRFPRDFGRSVVLLVGAWGSALRAILVMRPS